jgi:hypothetical protein
MMTMKKDREEEMVAEFTEGNVIYQIKQPKKSTIEDFEALHIAMGKVLYEQ